MSDIYALLQHRAISKELEFSYDIAANVPSHILGDVTRLRQIVTNLLGNALKFTEAGYVKLSLTVEEPADDILPERLILDPQHKNPQHKLHFAIQDTGIGIPVEKQGMLFQPFVQADASTTRKYGGTGLGLVISKRLAEHMGGTMWVESDGSHGSTFHFTISATAAAPQLLTQKIAGATRRTAPQLLAGMAVLLVEDNIVNQKVALRMLKNLGVGADLANDGIQAVKAATTKQYDLIIMDIHMPNMDGYEATQEIRKLALTPAPQIIAMTASVLETDRQQAIDAGMNDFLTKPVKLENLAAVVARLPQLSPQATR